MTEFFKQTNDGKRVAPKEGSRMLRLRNIGIPQATGLVWENHGENDGFFSGDDEIFICG